MGRNSAGVCAAPDPGHQGPVGCPSHLSPPPPCSSWQQPLGTTKPRYLEQLENYLRKELLLLDLGTDSAQELRLQVRATE